MIMFVFRWTAYDKERGLEVAMHIIPLADAGDYKSLVEVGDAYIVSPSAAVAPGCPHPHPPPHHPVVVMDSYCTSRWVVEISARCGGKVVVVLLAVRGVNRECLVPVLRAIPWRPGLLFCAHTGAAGSIPC